MNPIRVLVVGNDPLARAGLANLLASQPNVIVTGQVASDSELESAVRVYQPEVAVWDLGLAPTIEVEKLGAFRDAGIPVVALVPEETIAGEAWAAGARGLVLRDANVEQLVSALVAVTDGLAVFSPTLSSALFPSRNLPVTPPGEELTPREREVLQALAEGASNKEIARRLEISEHTVKFHVNSILSKLNAQSRTEAVVRATRLGLVLL